MSLKKNKLPHLKSKQQKNPIKHHLTKTTVILETESTIQRQDFPEFHIETKNDRYYVLLNKNYQESIEKIYGKIKSPLRIIISEPTPRSKSFKISAMSIGNLSDFNSFVDPYTIYQPGEALFFGNMITIIIGKEENKLKFMINADDLDDYIFLYMDGMKCNLSITLNKVPKIFLHDKINNFWKRASILDFPAFRDRFDIQLSTYSDFSFFTNFFTEKILIYSDLRHVTSEILQKLSLRQIRSICSELPFDEYYYLECILSQKGRFIMNKLTLDDLKKWENISYSDFFIDLNNLLSARFLNVSNLIDSIISNHKERKVTAIKGDFVKTGVITPFRVILNFPMRTDLNRVLREFDIVNFIRFGFREEDGIDLIGKKADHSTSHIFDYFRNILTDGIFIGQKKFFLLAMSASQLRLHSAWFLSPYSKENILIGPDYIRSWMGDFSKIHNIGKYAVRLGQVLSTTIKTVQITNYKEIKDIIRNNYNFTDGVGLIKYSVAKSVAKILNLQYIPSAFQIRFAGYKGVVAIADIKEDLILRESMKKFEANYNFLEIVTFAQRKPCYLNRQIIVILESLGVSKSNIIKIHDQYVKKLITQKNIVEITDSMDEIKSKSRIFVPRGRCLIGVVDDLGVLEENEIFVMTKINKEEDILDSKVIVYDNYAVINSEVLVAKNPCLHPGDIQIVKAVNKKELHYLKECVVFSRKGERPVFNMCSGSDLDGDVYTIVWDQGIFPPRTEISDTYESSTMLSKQVISMTDIVNFFIKYMQEDQIGLISNAHLAHSDRAELGVREEKVIKLANIFNRGIDFPKTGYVASLPYDLVPEEVPDYMESSGKKYLSKKCIGILFRRTSSLNYPRELLCSCAKCCDFKMGMDKFKDASAEPTENITLTCKNIILKGNEIVYPAETEEYVKEARLMFKLSKQNLNANLNLICEKYRLLLTGKEGKIRAMAWRKFACSRSEHSLVPFIVDSCINIEEFYKKDPEFILFRRFALNEKIVIVDKSEFENFKKTYKGNNIIDGAFKSKYAKSHVHSREHISFCEGDLKLPQELIFVIASASRNEILKNKIDEALMKLLKGKSKSIQENNATVTNSFKIKLNGEKFTPSENLNIKEFERAKKLLEETFLILLALNFINLHDFPNIFNFFEFLIESVDFKFERSSFSNLFFRLSTSYYTLEHFNTFSDAFVSFLLYNFDDDEYILEKRSNSLLLCAYLLTLNIPLRYKIDIAENFSKNEIYNLPPAKNIEVEKHKIHLVNNIVIIGMFDQYDEVYLDPYNGQKPSIYENTNLFVPKLLNFGTAPLINYKEMLRQFIVSHVLNRKGEVKIKIVPGILFFHGVPQKYRNNNFAIKELRDLIDFSGKSEIKAHFEVDFPLLDETKQDEYIKRYGLKFKEKKETISLKYSNMENDLTIYFGKKLEILKVTCKSKLLGRFQIVKTESPRLDLNIELINEEIVETIPIGLTTQDILFVNDGNYHLHPIFKMYKNIQLDIETFYVLSNGVSEINLGVVKRFEGFECKQIFKRATIECECAFQNKYAIKHKEIEEIFQKVWMNINTFYNEICQ